MSTMIRALWRNQPGDYFLLATLDPKTKKWHDHFFAREDLGLMEPFIEGAKRAGKNVYFCPHGYSEPKKNSRYALPPHMGYADLDAADPRNCKVTPTIAIESSPGRYVGLWLTEAPISWDLNRRLTYYTGADKGGWGPTKVLRLPNTVNFKYAEKPKVKILWDDGAVYTVPQLEKLIPAIHRQASGPNNLAAIALLDDPRMTGTLRRDLMAERVPEDRSKVLWRLENDLIGAGFTAEEMFTLLSGTVHNKFRDHHNDPDEALRKDILKCFNKRLSAEEKNGTPLNGTAVFADLLRMSDVKRENVDWIWFPLLARGEITVIEGDPGVFKSYAVQMMCKAICNGETLPSWDDYTSTAIKGGGAILGFDNENAPTYTTQPRLEDNGLKNSDNFYVYPPPLSWTDKDDILKTEALVERIKPTVIYYDTMNTYIGGKTNTDRANQSTAAMTPLRDIARKYKCAVIIIRHMVKNRKDMRALAAGQGSIAIGGYARIAASVDRLDKENQSDVYALAVWKCNIGPPVRHLMPFQVKGQSYKSPGTFQWLAPVAGHADELIAVPAKGHRGPTKQQEVEKWLYAFLEDGEKEGREVMRAAQAHGLSKSDIKNYVYTASGIDKRTEGKGDSRKTYWSLSDGPSVQTS